MRGEAFPTPQPGQAAPGEPDRELSRESLAGRSNGWIAEQLRQAAGLLAAQLAQEIHHVGDQNQHAQPRLVGEHEYAERHLADEYR